MWRLYAIKHTNVVSMWKYVRLALSESRAVQLRAHRAQQLCETPESKTMYKPRFVVLYWSETATAGAKGVLLRRRRSSSLCLAVVVGIFINVDARNPLRIGGVEPAL